jgi:hypothetical protein
LPFSEKEVDDNLFMYLFFRSQMMEQHRPQLHCVHDAELEELVEDADSPRRQVSRRRNGMQQTLFWRLLQKPTTRVGT